MNSRVNISSWLTVTYAFIDQHNDCLSAFASCLAIVSAVTVGGLFLWPALRYGRPYQTVWETRPSAETPSDVHWRCFYFQLTCVHSALELSGRYALQIYLLTYLLTYRFLLSVDPNILLLFSSSVICPRQSSKFTWRSAYPYQHWSGPPVICRWQHRLCISVVLYWRNSTLEKYGAAGLRNGGGGAPLYFDHRLSVTARP